MRIRLIVLCVVALSLSGAPRAQEVHTLTSPTSVTTSTYTLQYIGLDVANSRIVVQVVSNAGVQVTKTYDASTSPTGATLLHNLNTANFSSNSLVKAVFNRLIADGAIPAGSVAGSPQ